MSSNKPGSSSEGKRNTAQFYTTPESDATTTKDKDSASYGPQHQHLFEAPATGRTDLPKSKSDSSSSSAAASVSTVTEDSAFVSTTLDSMKSIWVAKLTQKDPKATMENPLSVEWLYKMRLFNYGT